MFWNKKLNKQDLNDFKALTTLLSQETFRYHCIKNNTVQIPKGQALAAQQYEILGVLQQAIQEWIGVILRKYNCEKGFQYRINAENGKITEAGSTNEIIPEALKGRAK